MRSGAAGAACSARRSALVVAGYTRSSASMSAVSSFRRRGRPVWLSEHTANARISVVASSSQARSVWERSSEAGHQDEHAAAGSGSYLGDPEAGQGLARPAGHEELAACVGLREVCDGAVDRLLLVFPGGFRAVRGRWCRGS